MLEYKKKKKNRKPKTLNNIIGVYCIMYMNIWNPFFPFGLGLGVDNGENIQQKFNKFMLRVLLYALVYYFKSHVWYVFIFNCFWNTLLYTLG